MTYLPARSLGALLVSGVLLTTLPAHSLDLNSDSVNFSGFATVSYGKALHDDGGLTSIYLGEDGEYRDFNVLGLRLDTDLHDRAQFAVQMTASGITDYDPEFQWIYLNLNLMNHLDARVGRIRIPLFAYSDYLDVGYAYPWISPPSMVYNDGPFRTVEGISLINNMKLGPVDSTLQVYGGKTEEELAIPGFEAELRLEDVKGFAWSLEYEWLQTRASYFESKSNGDLATIDSIGPTIALFQAAETIMGGNFMDTILWEDDEAYFAGLGLTLDFDSVFLIAEKTQVRKAQALPVGDVDSYYLTAGIRPIENWTFALTFAHDHDRYKNDALKEYMTAYGNFMTLTGGGLGNSFDLFGLGALDTLTDAQELGFAPTVIPFVGALPGVGGILTIANATPYNDDDTYMLNARWDFHPKAAMKFEYMYRQMRSSSVETNLLGMDKKTDSDAFRIALDLVF